MSAGFGLVLGAAGHAVGWPFPRGGAGQLAAALTAHLRSLGVVLETGAPVDSIDDLPPHRVVLCDLSPREVVRIAGERFPSSYRRQLADFGTAPEYARSIGPWTVPSRGLPRAWVAPALYIWAARPKRSRSLSARCGMVTFLLPLRHRRATYAVRSVARAHRQAHRLGVLSRAERFGGRYDRADRSADRALRSGLSWSDSGRARRSGRRTSNGAIAICRAEISPAERTAGGRWSRAPPHWLTRHRIVEHRCARRRHRPEAASTDYADTSRRGWRCGGCGAGESQTLPCGRGSVTYWSRARKQAASCAKWPCLSAHTSRAYCPPVGAAAAGGAGVSVLVGTSSLSERLVRSLLTAGNVDFSKESSRFCCSASLPLSSL